MEKVLVSQKTELTTLLRVTFGEQLTYGSLMKLYRKKDIKVNGKRVSNNCELNVGDLVEVYFQPKAANLSVIYKDENLLVLNKPKGKSSDEFYNQVKGEFPTAIYTHRLDTNTSGIIMFALNQEAYEQLFNGFKNRTFEKYYYCLVNGVPKKQSALLSDYMFKDAKKGIAIVYSNKVKGSLPIQTEYQVVKSGKQSAVLKVKLITGRTHQIRAHLAYHGHFIIGDGKYGDERINKQFRERSQLLISGETILRFNESSKLYYLNGKKFTAPCESVFEKLR